MGRLSRSKYLFDECVTPAVPKALKAVGYHGVTHINSIGLTGTTDVVIAQICSTGGRILVTRDRKQLVNLDEVAALRSGKVRAVFLPNALASYSPWEMLKWFARHWDGIETQASRLKAGEILLVDLRGKSQMFDDVMIAAAIHDRRTRIAKSRAAAKARRLAAAAAPTVQ